MPSALSSLWSPGTSGAFAFVCAAANPPAACVCAALPFASSRPLRTCPITTKPRRSTTAIDISSAPATTRSWRLRRHNRTAGSSGPLIHRINNRGTGPPDVRSRNNRRPSGTSPKRGVLRAGPAARSVRAPGTPGGGAALPRVISARSGLVTDTADGHDDLRPLRVLLDLRAKTLHVHVNQTGVGGVAIAPHLLEQHLTGEDLPRLEGDGLPLPLHRVTGHVDDEVPDRQLLGRGLLRPPQTCPDPGDQLLRLERLDDVVVGPGFQAHHHIDRVALGSEHDDRHT